MKTSIKTIIGVVAIAIGSISMAQAGEHRNKRDNDRHYDKPRQERQFRHDERRSHWKRAHNRHDRFRAKRHAREYRFHKRQARKARRHLRAYKRLQRWERHHGWKRDYRRSGYGYDYKPYRAPRHSSHISVRTHHSGNALPVIAGGIIGSAIANDASHGDPAATFGGAVFGALVGNALSQH